jgi:hypothetical protein
MVKDFLQRERERAAEEARDEKTRAEADQRAKTRAAELEQKIADYIKLALTASIMLFSTAAPKVSKLLREKLRRANGNTTSIRNAKVGALSRIYTATCPTTGLMKIR